MLTVAALVVPVSADRALAADPGAFAVSARDGRSETVTAAQALTNRAIEATGAGSSVTLDGADVVVGISDPTNTNNARLGIQVSEGASASVVNSTLQTDGTLDYRNWQSSYWGDTAVDVVGDGSTITITDSSIIAGADAVAVTGAGATATLVNTGVQVGTSDAATGFNGPGKGVAVRDGATATIEGGSITTTGSASQYWHGGVETPGGVPNNLADNTLFRQSAVEGDSAIYVRGIGSNVDATDVDILVTGSPGNNSTDTSINTHAVAVLGGAQTTITGGSVTTTGDARTTGVYVQAYSNLDGYLEDPRNAATSVTLNNVEIRTEGMATGVGVKAYSNSRAAETAAPDGTDPQTQTVQINGGSVYTSGTESYGLVAQNYGSTVIADTWNGAGLTVDTEGVNAHGVVVYGNATADLTGTAINTYGTAAYGISLNEMGPLSAPSSAPAPDGTLLMQDGSVTTHGANATGVYVGGGATATIDNTDIVTKGRGANAVAATGAGSTVTLNGGVIRTNYRRESDGGPAVMDTHALLASDGGTIAGSNLLISGSSDAYNDGVVAAQTGSSITLTNSSVSNELLSAEQSAVGASASGAGSSLVLDNTSVSVETNKGSYGASAAAVKAWDGGSVSMNVGVPAVDPADRNQISSTGNYVFGVVSNGSGSEFVANNVAISTSGDYAHGVATAVDAETILTNSSVLTTGFHSYALQSKSHLDVDNVAIQTRGDESAGVQLTGSAAGTAANLDITTAGNNAAGILIDSGSFYTMTGGEIATTGNASAGLLADQAGILTVDTVAITTSGDAADGVYLTRGTVGASIGGDTTIDVSGLNSHAITIHQASDLTLSDSNLSATGDGGIGLYVHNGSTVIANNVNIVVGDEQTAHDAIPRRPREQGADVAAMGSKLTMVGGSVTTLGADNIGLNADRATIEASGVVITTYGDHSAGLTAYHAPTTEVDTPTIATFADGSITAYGDNSTGVHANAHTLDASVSVSGTTITMNGSQSVGALSSDGGVIALADTHINALGDGSVGLGLENSTTTTLYATTVASSAASIVSGLTSAGQTQAITIDDGSVLTANDGTLLAIGRNENGADGVVGLLVSGGSTVAGDILDQDAKMDGGHTAVTVADGAEYEGRVDGVRNLVASGGKATLSDGSVLGNIHAGPGGVIEATNTWLQTAGKSAHAVVAEGGVVSLTGGSVTTAADRTYGLLARGVGGDITSSADVTTTGEWAFGAYADDGANITLGGGTVTTSGVRAHGLLAEDGATIDTAADVVTLGDKAHGVQAGSEDHGDSAITLSGGSVSTSGSGAYGLLATFGSSITGIADIHTVGDGSFGASADGDGYINLTGGQITTEGSGSHGLLVNYDLRAQGPGVLDANVDVTTSGANAFGVQVLNGGSADLTGGVIATTGAGSFGVAAIGVFSGVTPSPSSVSTDQVTITTTGSDAYGLLLASGATGNLAGSSVTTSGNAAHAVTLVGEATLVVADSSIKTTGDNAAGFALIDNANLNIADTDISTSGATFMSKFTQSGQIQDITVASGVVAVDNNGTLLLVSRDADGGDGIVNFELATGSSTRGNIIDTGADNGGYTNVIVASGADFVGQVKGVRNYQSAPGSNSTFEDEVEIEGDFESTNSTTTFEDRAEVKGDLKPTGGTTTFKGQAGIGGDFTPTDSTSTFEDGAEIGGNVNSTGSTSTFRRQVSIGGDLNSTDSTTIFEDNAEVAGNFKSRDSSHIFSGKGATINGDVELEDGSSTTGGTLEDRIYVAGNVSSDSDSTIGGNWRVQGNMNTAGVVSPGNSIGSVSVGGDYTFQATAVYEAEVDRYGDADLIEVGGTAYLDGTVRASALDGFAVNTPYTIVTAGDGFADTEFQGVTWAGSNVFVSPTLSYDPNTVYLSFERSGVSFARLGVTGNQRATAQGLDGYGFDNELATSLAFLPEAQAPSALDQLSGEVHASTKSALLQESHFLRDAVASHLRSAFGKAETAQPASGLWWGYGFGSWNEFDATSGAARMKSSVGGFMSGIDATLSSSWKAGLMGGYSRTSLHVDDRASSAISNNYHLGAYTGADLGGLNLTAAVSNSWHKVKTRRSANFVGLSDPTLADDYNGRTFQAFAEISHDFGADDLTIMPYADIAYVRLHMNDRAETGKEAALAAGSQNMETVFTTLGLNLSSAFDLGGVKVRPIGRFGWRHAFNDVQSVARQHFAGESDFDVQGVPLAKDAATLEAGLNFDLSGRATLGVSYQGQHGSGVAENSIKGSLRVAF